MPGAGGIDVTALLSQQHVPLLPMSFLRLQGESLVQAVVMSASISLTLAVSFSGNLIKALWTWTWTALVLPCQSSGTLIKFLTNLRLTFLTS